MDYKTLITGAQFCQIGLVVHNLEEAKARYALLFGVEEPGIGDSGKYEITKTTIFGKPAPEAGNRMAFFKLTDGVELELIEPNAASSTWRDHLEKYGEGIHHIAFKVTDTAAAVKELEEKFGGVLEQQGFYADGSGTYTYVDVSEALHLRLELLESF